jgi:trans-aconitate 2-methyltransferase
MPRNYGEPSHLLLAETARSDKWRQLLGEVTRAPPVAPPDDYLRILRGHANLIDIWETTYLQVLQGEDPVAEWARATGARPYLDAARDESDAFIADYTERLRVAYPPEPDGTTLFPFRRLFIVATR